MRQTQQEPIQAKLALLLAPETEEHLRVRVVRYLGRQGPAILPLFVSVLNQHPEITASTWPWWPSQYAHCARLLLHLCQQASLTIEALLQSSLLAEPIGPVLWACIIETGELQPCSDPEGLFVKGLEASWITVRYAAATALANRASRCLLRSTSLARLHSHCGLHEDGLIRLTVACALLRSGEAAGLDTLLQLTVASIQEGSAFQAIRKAALFVLGTEIPPSISAVQREQLHVHLVYTLQDNDPELAFQAALALSKVGSPMLLPLLSNLLASHKPQTQLYTLTVLEELAKNKTMRQIMRHLALPTRILPFLRAESVELRRQASYALAAYGGEYAVAALGSIVFNTNHPGHLEAIEGLRQLQGVLHAPLRDNVIRWLLATALQPCEETQITTLDSLIHLLWQARTRGQKRTWHDISQIIIRNGAIIQLLADAHPQVRQRTLDLLVALNVHPQIVEDLQPHMQHPLYTDQDN